MPKKALVAKPKPPKVVRKKTSKKADSKQPKAVKPIKPTAKRSVLFKKANRLPIRPGLYAWLDDHGTPIYVGRAKNIRKRAKQHLKPGKSDKDVARFSEKAQRPVYKYVQQPSYAHKLEKIAVRAYKPGYNKNLFF